MAAGRPTTRFERAALARGFTRICGIDEVGRGCLAGAVVAAAVIFPPSILLRRPPRLRGVRDSKIVTAAERERLRDAIYRHALAVGVGAMPCELIDAVGIGPATRLAMEAAIDDLGVPPDHLLIDAVKLRAIEVPQSSIIDGDYLCFSIAAASIVAKTLRDEMMRDAEVEYPGYSFAEHKGYATPVHRAALAQLGPSPLHRRSFGTVRQLVTP